MSKTEFKKQYGQLYFPGHKEFSIIDVPPMNFIMIDGHGNPNNNPQYNDIIQALYSAAFTLKFAMKPKGHEFTVAPLEGLWWMENMAEFSVENKDRWDWTMMIMQPEFVTSALVEQVLKEIERKKSIPELSRMRFETYQEGLCVQIMYFGVYADEGPAIARMHAYIAENGYVTNGKHHEIYIGDPRKSAPEKLRTVIRQPIRKT